MPRAPGLAPCSKTRLETAGRRSVAEWILQRFSKARGAAIRWNLRQQFAAERIGPMSQVPERLRFRRLRFGEAAEAVFTLIELLVVLLIIGTLLAIVIPTFLTTAKTANNTAAPANLLYTSGNESHRSEERRVGKECR